MISILCLVCGKKEDGKKLRDYVRLHCALVESLRGSGSREEGKERAFWGRKGERGRGLGRGGS